MGTLHHADCSAVSGYIDFAHFSVNLISIVWRVLTSKLKGPSHEVISYLKKNVSKTSGLMSKGRSTDQFTEYSCCELCLSYSLNVTRLGHTSRRKSHMNKPENTFTLEFFYSEFMRRNKAMEGKSRVTTTDTDGEEIQTLSRKTSILNVWPDTNHLHDFSYFSFYLIRQLKSQ